jgi:hypothetical protein
MTKKWIAANVVLLLTAALLGWQLYVSVDGFREANDPAKISPVEDVKRKITLESGLPPLQSPRQYNAAEFESIASKNLFAPSRSPEEKAEPTQVAETPALDVKPDLVGVIQSGGESLALVVDPAATDGKRRAQTKRVGDNYRGYTVTEIAPGRMVLELGSRREIISLFDGSRRSGPGGKTPIVATRVVAFGSGSSYASAGATRTGGGPTVIETARPAAAPASATRTSTRSGQAGAQPGSSIQSVPVQAPASGQQAPSLPGETRDSQGRRVIRTPWGDIVQPEQPTRRPPNQ